MGLSKVTYTDNVTVIGATNLNDIQDAIIDLEDEVADIEDIVEDSYAIFPQKTITSTSIASFSDGADDVPVKELIVSIDAVSYTHLTLPTMAVV